MAARVVTLAPGVHRIPTVPGDFINSYAFVDDDGSVTLVDTGLKRAPARIVAGLAAIGKHPRDVTRIVLTHAHLDHAGGARALLPQTRADGVEVHHEDLPYIEQGRPPDNDRSTTAGRIFARMPAGGFAPAPVVGLLRDGEVLDVAGGLRVVHTPGHTPGHISLLHEPTGVLITGDSIFNVTRRIAWPTRFVCTSFRQTQETAAVLGDLEYEVAAFTHGPEIRDHAREQVRAFLRAHPPGR